MPRMSARAGDLTLGTIVDATDFGFQEGTANTNIGNHNALVAAHGALPPGGGTIYIPPGTYPVTMTIAGTAGVFTKPTHLLGAGRGATRIVESTHGGAVLDFSGRGHRISNMTIAMDVGDSQPLINIESAAASNELLIDGCNIEQNLTAVAGTRAITWNGTDPTSRLTIIGCFFKYRLGAINIGATGFGQGEMYVLNSVFQRGGAPTISTSPVAINVNNNTTDTMKFRMIGCTIDYSRPEASSAITYGLRVNGPGGGATFDGLLIGCSVRVSDTGNITGAVGISLETNDAASFINAHGCDVSVTGGAGSVNNAARANGAGASTIRLFGGRYRAAGGATNTDILQSGSGVVESYGADYTSKSGTITDWSNRSAVIATASIPAAGASQDGKIIIEDAAVGDRNIILYAGGQRFRIDGGVPV